MRHRDVERPDTLTHMDSDPVTPNDLARELCATPQSIRGYVRSKYGHMEGRDETRWQLKGEQATDVRHKFQRRAGR